MKSAGNAFYILLVIVSTLFAVTALCYSFPLDQLPLWFQEHGWKLLLGEVGFIILCGLLSMGYDQPAAGAPTGKPEEPASSA